MRWRPSLPGANRTAASWRLLAFFLVAVTRTDIVHEYDDERCDDENCDNFDRFYSKRSRRRVFENTEDVADAGSGQYQE